MRALLLLVLCFTIVSAVPHSSQRIIGGTVTTIDNYPDVAALLLRFAGNFIHMCGGSVLNQKFILTAAHCVYFNPDTSYYRFRLGSSWSLDGGTVYETDRLIPHPEFSLTTIDNDIGIVETARFIVYSNVVQPGVIAGPNYNLLDNEVVWAVGWGITSIDGEGSEQLRHVQIWTINQEICNQRYENYYPITANMLCVGWLDVGGRGQCTGDSGGPLYHHNVIVGVCSFGFCADAYYPSVNARVTRYTAWIQANT